MWHEPQCERPAAALRGLRRVPCGERLDLGVREVLRERRHAVVLASLVAVLHELEREVRGLLARERGHLRIARVPVGAVAIGAGLRLRRRGRRSRRGRGDARAREQREERDHVPYEMR
jgi:hypothetical protein